MPAFTAATARRVVRSDPVNPIATSRRCTTSAPIRPPERSTSSSIFGRNGSIIRGRSAGRVGDLPDSRNRTYRATVWWSQPTSSAAFR